MEKYLLINDIDEKEARSIFEWIDSLQDGATAAFSPLSYRPFRFAIVSVGSP